MALCSEAHFSDRSQKKFDTTTLFSLVATRTHVPFALRQPIKWDAYHGVHIAFGVVVFVSRVGEKEKTGGVGREGRTGEKIRGADDKQKQNTKTKYNTLDTPRLIGGLPLLKGAIFPPVASRINGEKRRPPRNGNSPYS